VEVSLVYWFSHLFVLMGKYAAEAARIVEMMKPTGEVDSKS
jgi:hypothetical protein